MENGGCGIEWSCDDGKKERTDIRQPFFCNLPKGSLFVKLASSKYRFDFFVVFDDLVKIFHSVPN